MSKLSKDDWEKFRRAGKIASRTLSKAKKYMTAGKKLKNICDSLENDIRRQSAEPAFPVNISVNQIAAHYSSPADDELALPERAIVKIDLGAHIDGRLSDTARTYLIGPNQIYKDLKETAELALEKAIEIIKPGIRPGDIGEVIETTIKDQGLTPITDLSGHLIEPWKLHAGVSIPNHKPFFGFLGPKLKRGQIIAIEPFVTTAEGSEKVYDESYSYIFSQSGTSARTPDAKKILKVVKKYHRLPFAIRWLDGLLPTTRLYEGFKELLAQNSLTRYPMLVSESQTPVAQAEHTVIITRNGCEVITS